ncbi:hypothetical protein [uncultured Akkermansia sp.]|jgi:hypothetical protein|uniref:hypothetical protein n=1 Tax=uncultured Akkermansia sp. TaxID=512294 RepID=UPI0025E8E17D|nr:hypothetical protein [uncultured Akkermansia sp.]
MTVKKRNEARMVLPDTMPYSSRNTLQEQSGNGACRLIPVRQLSTVIFRMEIGLADTGEAFLFERNGILLGIPYNKGEHQRHDQQP